jgi:voltage-gated potassium channel
VQRIPVPRPRPRVERAIERINLWRALALIATAAAALIFLESLAMRLVEPETFTSYGVALWFSVVTVATVGYGDIVPKTDAGRATASILILFGMAWIPLVASLVVASLTQVLTRTQREEHERALAHVEARLDALYDALEERRRDGYGDESPGSSP